MSLLEASPTCAGNPATKSDFEALLESIADVRGES